MAKSKKPKMGRPAKADETMSEAIRFRVTKGQKKRMQKAADKEKADLSDFIRDASLEKAGRVIGGE